MFKFRLYFYGKPFVERKNLTFGQVLNQLYSNLGKFNEVRIYYSEPDREPEQNTPTITT